jgi:hypothetical protein
VVIQLYIEGQRVELFKDESVTITDSIQNVKDIGSIFTAFSQSFNVPASKANNKIFKHYYNYDIDLAYSFNANDLVSGIIELNNLPFRKGFIGLDGVTLKNNKAHSYKITFFGETVDLKTKLKETKLSTVFQGVTTYDHEYGVSTVKTGLQSSLASGAIRYPLISHTERLFFDSGTHTADDRNLHYDTGGGGGGSHNHGIRYNDLKPAIKLSTIVDEIENFTGLTFTSGASDDFFDETNNPLWGTLYLWLSRVKGALGLNVTGTAVVDMPFTDFDFSSASPNEWSPELQGTTPAFSPYSRINSGVWTIRPQAAFFPSDTSYQYYTTFTLTSTSQYTMIIEDVTSTPFTVASTTGTGTLTLSNVFVGTNNVYGQIRKIRYRVTSEDPAITFTPTIDFKYQIFQSGSLSTFRTQITGNAIEPNGAVSNIVVSDQMPDLKVIDFLTGLFKMFNLTAFVQDDGKIKVMTLDNFYNAGNSYDVSEFIDVNESNVNFAIPYQEIAFRFKKPNTFLGINFSEINNKVFADLESTTAENADVQTTNRGGKYVVQLPFGKMIYERLNDLDDNTQSLMQYGYCTDKDQNPINIDPLILNITNETLTTGHYLSFYNGTSTGTAAGLTTYNRPSNTYGTSQSLSFGTEIDEYTGLAEDDSLFENYYKNYIVDTFNAKRRLVKVKAFLPLRVLLNYQLNDVFIINGREYIINSVNTNLLTGKSDLELLNKL